MGRPQKKGLSKFYLEVDFFSGDTIRAISSEFGLKGEISLIKILCAIFKCGYYLKWNNANKLRLLGQLPGVNDELLRQIVGRLVKWDYFSKDLFDKHKVLTNRQIQEEYFLLIRRRVVPDKLPYLLVVVNNNGVSDDINSISADKNGIYVRKYPFLEDINMQSGDFPVSGTGVSAYRKGVSVDINSLSAHINEIIADINSISADKNDNPDNSSPLSPTPPITSNKEKNNNPKGLFQKKKKGGPPRKEEKEKSCAKKEKAGFSPPSLEQIQSYCTERGLVVNPEKFFYYYSANGWKVGDRKEPMEDWRAKLEEWDLDCKNKRKNEPKARREQDAHTPRNSGNTGKKGTNGADISDI